MKRFSALLLTAIILCSTLFPTAVFAQEQILIIEGVLPTYEKNSGPSYEALRNYVDMTALRAYLDEKLQGCVTEFDVSQYNIPVSMVDKLIHYIYKDIPEAFHVQGMSYSYNPLGGNVLSLYPTYGLSKTMYDYYLKQCQDVAAVMTRGLDDARLSDAEKALILHDRLAVYNEYDISCQAPYTYEMVGALVNRTSVCEGYSMAYSYLLDQVGIRNYYVTSELLNHGWNMVYIDGVPYHVDVTWDDPLTDTLGYVSHDNFLRSTGGMLSTGHRKNGAYDFGTVAQDTRYDNAYWQCSQTSFQLLDGQLYYVDASSYETKLMQVTDGEDRFLANTGFDGFESPKLSSDGQDLLYSSEDKVYRYCVETNSSELVLNLNLSDDAYLCGFLYDKGILRCQIFDFSDTDGNPYTNLQKFYTPHVHTHQHSYDNACDAICNGCGEIRAVTHNYSVPDKDAAGHWLKCSVCGTVDENTRESHGYENACDTTCDECGAERTVAGHQYDGENDRICNNCGHPRSAVVRGDVDGKNGVDLDDAIYLLYHVNFTNAYPINQSADFDGSGKVDLDDAIYLLYHVNFPSVYPLYG